jgi:DNA-binding Lrp family transcriptional regulator
MCLRAAGGFTLAIAQSLQPVIDKLHIVRTSNQLTQLDAIDVAILQALQGNGRLSNVELAQQVHLSPSACLRRVKALEEAGVIARYVALLNARAFGRHGTSYTIINLENTQSRGLEAFEQAVRDQPEILDCFYVAGTNDYLVRFMYRDAADLERFHAEVLPRLPGVVRSNSMLVLRTVKQTTALPLADLQP